MELLAPAGNAEKLKYAYLYGADAAYIGIKNFSLRRKADNFNEDEYKIIREIKKDKKLYCALNIYFHNGDLSLLEENLDYIANYPFDAFIVSDLGVVDLLAKRFPDAELHLSTQANCINKYSARKYQEMGFKRVILGRETSLDDIKAIKDYNPGLEIETFVHGAMCIAYSGRCFLSKYMINRSANEGFCAHTCRWKYKIHDQLYLEEEMRPGEYYPIFEGDGFTEIMSSKDLCLIDHIKELKDAGIDSLKIEGRMKSIYYTSVITRAYRKAIDQVNGIEVKDFDQYREDLFNVSHREFTTGFFFDDQDVQIPTTIEYSRKYTFIGIVGEKVAENRYELELKNTLHTDQEIEFVGPDILFHKDTNYKIFDKNNVACTKGDHSKYYTIEASCPIKPGYIIRRKVD
ncbi:MAG: U32 family peptidase [Spirochaetales bacterium]|nr:U32 family peptidase [Spirochaetales bacterium]